MLIQKEVTVTIDGRYATLSEDIYLYKNDRNIDIIFTIVDSKYKFNAYSGNILVESTAKYATVKVLKPNGSRFTSNRLLIVDNKVVLTITQDFIDQIEEIGKHTVQIQLWDEEQGRVTLPPVTFTVLEPIFDDEDNNAYTYGNRSVDD
ncbi:MAG: hypothetical protein II309_01375 [Bacilli bacterium]|nr:hypothetical protein [Bacilli bacterium]